MSGSFADWQAEYARHGIPTFPVRIEDGRKTPAVRNYLNLGEGRSRELAARFPNSDAFGFRVGARVNVTVLDVDSPDERVLADALARHGSTPIVVRSGGGKFQAWYRHSGERRHIRPDRGLPIDVLGAGYVVAPPSRGSIANYQFLAGSLDDLAALPALQNAPSLPTVTPARINAQAGRSVAEGRRNDALFGYCLRAARGCDDFDALLDAAQTQNASFLPPLDGAEVTKTAASAWRYEQDGRNYASGGILSLTHNEIDGLLAASPDAFVLLTILRRHHWGRAFVVANEMARTMPPAGWRRERFAAARAALEAADKITLARPASRQYGPALYRWPGQFKGAQN